MENARQPPGAGSQADQRLDSWKEIASYVGRDVRTVQRWEKEEGLPVHRHPHKKQGTVYGFKAEIDSWWASRRSVLEAPPSQPSRWRWIILGAVVALISGAVALRFFITREPAGATPKILPLTTYPGDTGGGSFSPDGSEVAFSWNGPHQDNYDIYVKVLDAEKALRLTTDPAPDGFAAWSPDGRQIAFGRSRQPWGPPESIYLIPALGGPERRLAELFPLEHIVPIAGFSSWSPDGKWLAFPDTTSLSAPFSLHVISAETGVRRKLTSPAALLLGDGIPAFSPDGRTLAFVRAVGYEVADIYVMPASGGEPQRLTTDATRIWGLCWTPDSQEIIFSSNRKNGTALYRIPAGGGTPQRIPEMGGDNPLFALSYKNLRLTFTKTVSDLNIWRAGIKGSELVGEPSELIHSIRGESNPQYSPEGKRIAFVSNRSGNWEVWVCNHDGSDPQPLTKFGAGSCGWPSWSPDGTRIAFDSTARGEVDIYTVSVHGGEPRQLTVNTSGNAAPSWSPDGWIYFQSVRSGAYQVWKMPGDGGKALQVTKQGGTRPAVSPDGKFVYFSRGHIASAEGEVWRIATAGGEENLFLKGVEDPNHGRWAPVEGGFYFLHHSGSKRALMFFDFDTGQRSEVMPLEKPWDGFALPISPDRRWVLFSQYDYTNHDLMVVEGFR